MEALGNDIVANRLAGTGKYAEFGKQAVNTAQKTSYKVGSLTDEIKNSVIDAFKTWVNNRRSTEISGIQASRQFRDLDNEGMTAIVKFQAGNKQGIYGQVKNHFDTKYEQLKQAGMQLNYKKEYLPQMWLEKQEVVSQKLNKFLSRNPSFTFKSVIDNYAQGIEAGLHPRFTKVSDLAGFYETTLNKSLADREFFAFLEKRGLIVPESAMPRDWSVIKAEGFPVKRGTADTGAETIEHYASPTEITKWIDNYMANPEGAMANFANFVTTVKNMGLSAGVPKTAINAHGLNLYVRNVLSANNPIGKMLTQTHWWFNPNSADTFVKQNLDKAKFFNQHGLTITVEDYAYTKPAEELTGNLFKKSISKLTSVYDDLFADPLFKKVVPAIKISYADEVFQNLKQSMPEVEAAKKAAETANNMFGGMNLDALMRNKETQNILRSFILAPDWAETSIRIAKNTGKSLLNPTSPEGRAYRVFARNALFGYITANVINKLTSGHFMFENEGINRKFQLDTGTYTSDGKKRYISVFGTALDMARVPYEVAAGILSGNLGAMARPIANRLSMPAGAALHLISNTDYLGRPIYGNDKYGNPQAMSQQLGGVANELAQGLGVPSQARAGIDFLSGRTNLEQTLAQGLELPLKYEGGNYSKTQKEKQAMLQSAGISGGDLYSKMNSDKKPGGLFGLFSKPKEEETDPVAKALQKHNDDDEQTRKVKEIFSSGLTREQIDKALSKERVTYQDASFIVMKSLEVAERAELLSGLFKGMDNSNFAQNFKLAVKAKVITTGVIDAWEENGDISDAQAKQLKNGIKMVKGSYSPPKPKKTSISVDVPSLRYSPTKLSITPPKFETIPAIDRSPSKPIKTRFNLKTKKSKTLLSPKGRVIALPR